MEILLKDQESRVKNSGTTNQYFNLERGVPQGDQLVAYLFHTEVRNLISY